ncbi:MAG: single-stranded-DNA-specific exonuclease RecJ, partial [Arcobacter sp.]|nr:single-stranded-DNA-specific exonuclease RecJ [Arcobacter sp.]
MQNSYKFSFEDIEDHLKKRFEKNGGFLNLANLPFPNTFKDMNKACKRIVSAIYNKEKIIIVGDYDVDGVISTYILVDFFNSIGFNISSFIPNRFKHGYGISLEITDFVNGYDLIISVDNGITAIPFALWCKENGIDLIITDHHTPKETLPDAYAIINPKQKDCNFLYPDICGAFVTWYMISALKQELKTDTDLKSYLPYVAIATIADVMPLVHINRAVVIAGLKELNRSINPAFTALKDHLKITEFKSTTVSFWVAPLLNSAGRMDDASLALKFLQSNSSIEAAQNLLSLINTNELRKITQNEICLEADKKLLNKEDNVLIFVGENWHEGVLGIVASTMAKRYKKPSIAFTYTHDGILKGSGRSINGFNLFEAINLKSHFLEKFGGHTMAIGLTLKNENLVDFIRSLQDIKINENFDENSSYFRIDFETINFDLYNLLEKYEPFGEANPKPVFECNDVKILSSNFIGKNSEHKKYLFSKGNTVLEAVHFNPIKPIEVGNESKIRFSLEKNCFKNQEKLQLIII